MENLVTALMIGMFPRYQSWFFRIFFITHKPVKLTTTESFSQIRESLSFEKN